jgi:PAS domain S-box-containing protein
MSLSEFSVAYRAGILEAVLEHVADGIMFVDHGGNFLMINRAAREITGVSSASSEIENWTETFGCYLLDGITPYPSENLPLARAMRGESTDSEEIILKNKNLKKPVCISVSGRPLPPESGIAGGAVIVFRDVTRQRYVEQQLMLSNEGLQQFAYVAAHDLQEPLRAISSYLQLLAERCNEKLDEKGQKYLSTAIRGAERLQGLIVDLLTYCRINKKGKDVSRVDCAKALDQALEMLNIQVLEANAKVSFDKLPSIPGDYAQLVQLFQNLISNSVKYRSAEPPKIHVSVERRGPLWFFAVSDNGIGIDPQYFERIFLIFQRLHARNEYAGTGIGLALCKNIVERHGGKIWVTSEASVGSVFRFTMPALDEDIKASPD